MWSLTHYNLSLDLGHGLSKISSFSIVNNDSKLKRMTSEEFVCILYVFLLLHDI